MQLTQGQRVSHVADYPSSPSRPAPLRVGRTSDGIEDLLASHTDVTVPHNHGVDSQSLWQRRKSSKSTDRAVKDAIDAFQLDLLDAYEDEQDQITDLPSPPASASALPPRTSSLDHTSPLAPRRALSLEHTSTSQRPPHVPRSSSSRQNRPQPIRILEPSVLEDQAPQIQSARLPPTPSLVDADHSQGTFQKRHRRHMTISESKKTARSTIIVSGPSGTFVEHDLPPMPGLSPSTSIATSALSPVPGTPASAVAIPNEDKIRRELEMMTLQDGADTLLTHRYGGRVDSDLIMKLDRQADPDHDPTSPEYRSVRRRPERHPSDSEDRQNARRRKSIVEYFGRRSPVDKLLDYYLDDSKPAETHKPSEPVVESTSQAPQIKRKQSLARRMTMTLRGSPKDKAPELPPLPPSIPAGMI